jgi:hypothetical protein
MVTIFRSELPPHALLGRYTAAGAFTDCYHLDWPDAVDFSDYVAAFYTSSLFKVERALIARLLGKPAGDQDALRLAREGAAGFSAWEVEARGPGQLLLRDLHGRTRSWLMLAPSNDMAGGVRLYFGSAVLPKRGWSAEKAAQKPAFGLLFHLLSGFHHWYSKALLRSACARLRAVPRQPTVPSA